MDRGPRSGGFTQGQAQLRTTHDDGKVEHCCLGVLAVVAGLGITEDGSDVMLRGVRASYKPFQWYMTDENVKQLWEMNDGAGARQPRMSFNQIADWIEGNL